MTYPTSFEPEQGASTGAADQLNRECQCVSVDHARLQAYLEADPAHAGLYRLIRETRPNLFAEVAVFVSAEQIARMQAIVAAVETTVAQPAYRAAVLARAGAAAQVDRGTPGVFLAYDFHLTAEGPRLIEINTNAGGAFLNALLTRAQRACCPKTENMIAGPVEPERLEATLIEMFRNEWRLARGGRPLASVAIVDDNPTDQYLYPEFLLAAEMFRRQGIYAVIVNASDLLLCHGRLWHEETPIDLVYNRLTDFGLDTPEHTILREAWLQNAAVITPHPRAHALYADKRNLVSLSDASFLASLGLPAETLAILRAGIPHTVSVNTAQADQLWQDRRRWFFKPAGGFGSRAAYRGDKLTTRVWSEILASDNYVAQEVAAPAERLLRLDDEQRSLKFDVRAFVYQGEVQLFAARLYQGQTTNFRTAGGGFAPVFFPPSP